MRRVVTGHRNGKSVIVDDAEITGEKGRFGSNMVGVWETDGIPTIPLREGEYKKQPTFHFPKPGETFVNMWLCPPDEVVHKKVREEGVDLEEYWRKVWGDEPGMHTTDTVDYDIVLSGEIWMELDDGAEVHLKPFDYVVQNGTRHAWRNRSSENCVMACVLVGANRRQTTG